MATSPVFISAASDRATWASPALQPGMPMRRSRPSSMLATFPLVETPTRSTLGAATMASATRATMSRSSWAAVSAMSLVSAAAITSMAASSGSSGPIS